jgi:hypothetical protein
MAKVTIILRNQGSYLEEIPKNRHIGLGDALTRSCLENLEGGAEFAQLIRVS